jgi:uncharacterized protein YbjT (DUF2867 family)
MSPNTKEKFLVTSASGKTSKLVIDLLRAKGADVRALVRDPAKVPGLADKGVEVVAGDFDKPDVLAKALDGVTSVFLVTPMHPDAHGMVERFLAVATKSPSAPRIVRLSAIKGTEQGPTGNSRTHGTADRLIQESGLSFVILRPNYYLQNFFGSAEQMLSMGQFFAGVGDGKLGLIDVRDIADVAAAVLLDHQWDRGIYELTGPASVSFHDVARELGAALGREIKYVPVPPEAVRDSILKLGWGEWPANVLADYSRAYARGWGDCTTTFVEKIAGHRARSVADFAKEVFAPAFKR